jgi:hypothetical protein
VDLNPVFNSDEIDPGNSPEGEKTIASDLRRWLISLGISVVLLYYFSNKREKSSISKK